MRIAGILRNSVVNGEGIRDVIFTQGCPHHCKGCHNPSTWDVEGGRTMSVDDVICELSNSTNDVTISGGEPLIQLKEVEELLNKLHECNKSAWLYTGYSYEDIPTETWERLCISGLKVVVDGEFELAKKDLRLQFRGSSNQRLIDLPKTLNSGKIVLWEG